MKNEHENITSKNGWGGAWTEKKLDAFEKYVNAYLKIMNKNRYKFGWKLIYFDGFAGSGSRSEQNEQSSVLMKDLFDQKDITSSELNVYKGAAERVAALDKKGGFDYYYFIDYDNEASEALKTKLS
jgi:three-Cys-motif partner protein